MGVEKYVQESELELRVPIETYFNKYIVGRKKGVRPLSTSVTSSICPFHNEEDPSFHYWSSKNRFKCFGCGVSGNIVKMHQLTRKTFDKVELTSIEAMNELIGLFDLKGILPYIDAITKPKSAFDRARDSFSEIMDHTLQTDSVNLITFKVTNQQIINSGIDQEQKIKQFAQLDMLAGLTLSNLL